MAAETTKLTIRLPKAQVEFAKRYAKRHGVTVTEVIARYLHALQTAGVEELSPETCGWPASCHRTWISMQRVTST